MRANPLRVPLSLAKHRFEQALGSNKETAGTYLLVAHRCWTNHQIDDDEFATIVTVIAQDLRSMITGEPG
jgi:hypothetical protein